MTRFKKVEPEFLKSFLNYGESLKNMDIEARETKIQEMHEVLLSSSKKELKEALQEAFKTGFMTKEEYEKKWKNKYKDEEGFDSLSSILHYAVFKSELPAGKPVVVVTTNENAARDSKKIKRRFGVSVVTPAIALKQMKKIMKEEEMKKNEPKKNSHKNTKRSKLRKNETWKQVIKSCS